MTRNRSLTELNAYVTAMERRLNLQTEIIARLAAGLHADPLAWPIATDPTRSFIEPQRDLAGSEAGTIDARDRVAAAIQFLNSAARSPAG